MITDLHWWGHYGNPIPPEDNFTIKFYSDNLGKSGPEIQTILQSEFVGFSRVDSGLDVPGSTGAASLDIYKYDTFFSSPVLLSGSTPYYISIYNGIATPAWGWAKSDDASAVFYGRFLDSSTWGSQRGNLAFELTSDPIPEPTTFILFGIGLLGVARISRKK